MAESGDYEDPNTTGRFDLPTDEDIRIAAEEFIRNNKDNLSTFQPDRASTPRYRGEEFEMQTRNQEHTGLEPSYKETDFGGNERTPLIEKDSVEDIERRLDRLRLNKNTEILDIRELNPTKDLLSLEEKNYQIQKAKRFIKSRYPHFNKKSTGDHFF